MDHSPTVESRRATARCRFAADGLRIRSQGAGRGAQPGCRSAGNGCRARLRFGSLWHEHACLCTRSPASLATRTRRLRGAAGLSPAAERPLAINWILPPPTLAGGIRTTRDLAEACARRGHRVTLAFPDPKRPWPRPWQPRRLARHVRDVWRLRGRVRHHLADTDLPVVCVSGDRVEADDVPDADVSIATWWRTLEWIAPWPEAKGLHAYYVQHHELHAGPPDRVRATYRQPALQLVVSGWLERLMRDVYGAPHVVQVPVGIDHALFRAPVRRRGGPPTVGLMYSRRAWKGCEAGFAAIRRAQVHRPDLRVLCFGEDPPRRDERVPDRFVFEQAPPQTRIAEIYRSCDAWLLPSRSEGFGLPGLEALACGTPVVATRCGGPEDYVDDGRNGVLVDVDDAAAMSEGLLRLVGLTSEAWQRFSDAAQRTARAYRWEASAETLERALYEALERSRI